MGANVMRWLRANGTTGFDTTTRSTRHSKVPGCAMAPWGSGASIGILRPAVQPAPGRQRYLCLLAAALLAALDSVREANHEIHHQRQLLGDCLRQIPQVPLDNVDVPLQLIEVKVVLAPMENNTREVGRSAQRVERTQSNGKEEDWRQGSLWPVSLPREPHPLLDGALLPLGDIHLLLLKLESLVLLFFLHLIQHSQDRVELTAVQHAVAAVVKPLHDLLGGVALQG